MIPQNLINAVNNVTLICNEAKLSKGERTQIEADIALIIKEIEKFYSEPVEAKAETKAEN